MYLKSIRLFFRTLKREFNKWRGKAPRVKLQIKRPYVHLGSDYGGWSILKDTLNAQSVVFSFGIGTDISFDLALINEYGVTVNAFDPTPNVSAWLKQQQLPVQFHYFPYALSHKDEVLRFYTPDRLDYISHTIIDKGTDKYVEVQAKCLTTILKEHGHTQIDLLKMDIEGAEYKVIEDILQSKIKIKQLLVEFHHQMYGITTEQSEKAILALNQAGYQLFDISETGYEYSFVKI
ncbi:FkbM family methyltransferase [Runella slithyformis]|uniref:Methyltransferase FkbM family n=1 Tax=Runella slithyformis (strain ATCC 29530 / DSM 19594 / LMG 11500 / NCIMB 11436 / LSU 4) TaxID=761193 RepID=A0A7U4E752_RUNSL|nr:FkbM family methyltransferase [Runella slithyformis]AEI50298.1 methyltransferase FkbM family [Runella slithyformis DSM 19594]